MAKKDFKPYVSADTVTSEFTLGAVIAGVIMAVILGSANAYIGLKAGLTVAATFPAAVIGMAIIRLWKGSILEENMTRTIASVGEALVAGAIFTIPAFKIAGVWDHFNYFESTAIMMVGGVLGVLFVVLLRKILIEDSDLIFPESIACAEIHLAGRRGGSEAKTVLGAGVFSAFLYSLGEFQIIKTTWEKFLQFKPSEVAFLSKTKEVLYKLSGKGGIQLTAPVMSPAMLGVGYIIGPSLASITFAGGLLAWGLFVPVILFLNPGDPSGSPAHLLDLITNGTMSWGVASDYVFKNFVKPIAVGAMLSGAVATLWKMKSQLYNGISKAIKDINKAGGVEEIRTSKDLNFKYIFIAVGIILVAMFFLYYYFAQNILGALVATIVMGIAGFLFAAIAGYLVGLIGSSNNPISGLTLSTLIIAALLMVFFGVKGKPGIAAVLGVAAVVCCSSGIAGDMMQDLKVGHILGGTPWKMELGEIIGVIFAASVMIFPIMILDMGEGIGSKNLPAPQASLMAMLAKGIVGGQMAWPLVIVGIFMGIGFILVRAHAPMLIAVGMYLPFHVTFAIFIGGLTKGIAQIILKKKKLNEKQLLSADNKGILIASGLVAGEALMALALTAIKAAKPLPSLSLGGTLGYILEIIAFASIIYILISLPAKMKFEENNN